MRDMPPVDLAFIESAPKRIAATHHIAAPPEAVFASFAEPADWPKWFFPMTRAAWIRGTGGVGSEREVALTGLGVFRERIIAWEPGVRFSFTMFGSTSPLATQIGEDYRLSPDGNGGTRLDWVMAASPTLAGRLAWGPTWLLMQTLVRRGTKKLGRILVDRGASRAEPSSSWS